MGNEASQEGGEMGGVAGPPRPGLVTQQSAPVAPEAGAAAVRRGSLVAGAARRASIGVPPPALNELEPDLASLTEEERRVIRSVMARAQSMEEEPPKEEEEAESGVERCAVCRSSASECACVECGARTCRRCSRAIPSGKKHVWMCLPCSEKFPGLKSNSRDPENHSETPPTARRRTSDSGVLPPGDEQRPPARGRSDSLPGGQSPQHNRSQPLVRPPNGSPQFRGPRPDQPRTQQRARPDQQQRLPRPQHPVDPKQPQDPQRHPGDPRQSEDAQRQSQHPTDIRQQRPQHPTDPRQPQLGDAHQRPAQNHADQKQFQQGCTPRPQHPADPRQTQPADLLQRPQHPADPRQTQPRDLQKPQHSMDSSIQRPQHPMDQRQTQSGDMQRPQHPVDQRQPIPADMQRPQHPSDPRQTQPGAMQRPQHPTDPRQVYPGNMQRPPHPMDQRQIYPGDMQRPQHPMDQRQTQPGDMQKLQNTSDPKQPQMGNFQRPQHPIDPRQMQPGDMQRPPRPMDPRQAYPGDSQQRPMHPNDLRQVYPGDMQKPQHPMDPRLTQPGDMQRPQHPMDPRLPSLDDPQRQQDPRQQRHQDPRKIHPSESNRMQNQGNVFGPCNRDDLQRQGNGSNQQQASRDARPDSNKHFDEPVYPSSERRSSLENDLDFPKTSTKGSTEYQQDPPKPQHPGAQPEEIPVSGGAVPLPQQQRAEKPPPKRNQRLREPPEQQPVPRPEHPQEPLLLRQDVNPVRGSTNPFRTTTNPFRRESMPEPPLQSPPLIHPRRGSLDERMAKAALLDNKRPDPDESADRRHQDEEQRRNALNSAAPAPMPRTSLPADPPETTTRNNGGGIPRTVPLTSLSHSLEHQHTHQQQKGRDEWRRDEEADEEEEDYFEMIERAIGRPPPRKTDRQQPQVPAVLRQIDLQPDLKPQQEQQQATTDPPSAKHYLDEHKTQPVSYEAFSSAKAMQNGSAAAPLPRTNPPAYYYSQTAAASTISDDSAKNKQVYSQPTSSDEAAPLQTKGANKGATPPQQEDWSPVSDLSPILDVSPSVEAAEQELMEKFKGEEEKNGGGGVPRATSGTISGMLEEFTRALGLPQGGSSSPLEDLKAAVSPVAPPPHSPTQHSQERSPQKSQQPTTPRRSHRRLPQPTVEQMQAAVAMAAQTPPPTSTTTTGAMLFGLQQQQDTKESKWKSPEMQQSFEQAYNSQQETTAQPPTTVPSPAPRNQNKINNNQVKNSESTQPNPEGAPRKIRSASCGGPAVTRAAPEDLRNGNSALADLSSPLTPGTPRDKVAGGDSSDTQSEAESVKSVRLRRKLPSLPGGDPCPTPSPTRKTAAQGAKANGFFGDGTASPTPSQGSLKELEGSLRPPQPPAGTTPSPGADAGSKLPEYMQSLKQQLRDELKAVTEERKAMLEQRRTSPQPPPTSKDDASTAVSKSLATYQAQQAQLLKQLQAQSPIKTPTFATSSQLPSTLQTKTTAVAASSPYRSPLTATAHASQPQAYQGSPLLQYQNQPQVIQYKAQSSYTQAPVMTPSRAAPHQDALSVFQAMNDLGRKTPQPGNVYDSGRKTPQPVVMTPSRAGSTQDLSMYQRTGGGSIMTPSRVGSSQDLGMYQTGIYDSGRKTPQPIIIMTPSRTKQDFPAFDSGRRTPVVMTPSRAGSSQDLSMYGQSVYDSGRRTPVVMTPSRAGSSQDLSMYGQSLYDPRNVFEPARKKPQPMTPSRAGSSQDLSAYQTLYEMGRRTPQPIVMTPSRAGSSQDLTMYQTIQELCSGRRTPQPMTPSRAGSTHDLTMSIQGPVYESGRRTPQPMTPSRAGSSQDLTMYHQAMYEMGRRVMTPSRAVSIQDLYRGVVPQEGRRTPLPDAVPRYTGRPDDGDITVMTTATTTVVSASEWGGSRRGVATTVAPSVAAMESLKRRMTPQQKKGRRRHTSEIFAHMVPQQYGGQQCYTPTQPPAAAFRPTVDFPSIESHARATDLLMRSRHAASTPVNNDDAYFHTLNTEINRLRRSSENLYRDTMYEKQQQQWTPQDTIQTTERRKRKEKKVRKPRSWHPSPYVSEDEDEQLTREEKKAKIKAEIARRRMQIEENMRLHEQLCQLSSERQQGRSPSPPPDPPVASDDTSSVLKAIDEILRKDLYSGQQQQMQQQQQQQDYFQTPVQYVQTVPRHHRYGAGGGNWYDGGIDMQQQQQQAYSQQMHHHHHQHQQESSGGGGGDPESAMDESIAAIASTFPTTPDILLSASPAPLAPMPLLPDMPTRSRKLLENIGGGMNAMYQNPQRGNDSGEDRLSDSSSSLLRSQRKQQARTPVSSQKYEFPVKRILLTRDPKDRSVSGNGLGMRVVGGKEVPGSGGTVIGAYVAKIFPGGVVETLGEVKEGDQVLEWNGVPLTGRTYEEVQRIIASSADEVEIVIRCDLNMLEALGGVRHTPRRSSPGMGGGGGRGGDGPPDAPGGHPGGGGGTSPHYGTGSKRGGGSNHVMHQNNMMMQNNNMMIRAASYLPEVTGGGGVFGGGGGVVSVFSSGGWPELRDPFFDPADDFHDSDDFLLLEDEFENRWRHESGVQHVQHRVVCCGPRVVYVPMVRPSLKAALMDHSRRSHLQEMYEEEESLRATNSLGKLSLYLNGLLLREKGERPRAPCDLPGLRPVFVNEWKKTDKSKEEEEDDLNNNRRGGSRSGVEEVRRTVGSSPDATPYHVLSRGCRGSFCVIL